jgi:hypothetical protein
MGSIERGELKVRCEVCQAKRKEFVKAWSNSCEGYDAGALRTRRCFFVNAQDKCRSYLEVALNRYA